MADLKEFNPIYIHKGLDVAIQLNFTNFIFDGTKVMFTMKAPLGEITKQVTIEESQLDANRNFVIFLIPSETKEMDAGDRYAYDIVQVVGARNFALCLPSRVKVYGSVGGVE